MQKVSYRGYPASVDFVGGDLVINILGVSEKLEARCIRPADIEPAMRELVEDYLQRCEAAGRQPELPPVR